MGCPTHAQGTATWQGYHSPLASSPDTLLSILTVREMLLYTADLKRSTQESRKDKEAVVDEWISKLALDTCKDTRIGNNLQRGISGGQVPLGRRWAVRNAHSSRFHRSHTQYHDYMT